MILDEQGLFSDKQVITGTCVSTNILDMGYREVSFGTPIELFVQLSCTPSTIPAKILPSVGAEPATV